jgi:hypothetical protein
MTVTLPRVVSAWGVANAVLVGVLIAFGESAFAVVLYASSAALVELVALATWWSASRFGQAASASPLPRHGHLAVVAASAVPFVGLGLVYRPYMMIPAVFPMLDLTVHAIRARTTRSAAFAATRADEPATVSTGGKLVAGVGAGTAAVAAARLVRRWRR